MGLGTRRPKALWLDPGAVAVAAVFDTTSLFLIVIKSLFLQWPYKFYSNEILPPLSLATKLVCSKSAMQLFCAVPKDHILSLSL